MVTRSAAAAIHRPSGETAIGASPNHGSGDKHRPVTTSHTRMERRASSSPVRDESRAESRTESRLESREESREESRAESRADSRLETTSRLEATSRFGSVDGVSLPGEDGDEVGPDEGMSGPERLGGARRGSDHAVTRRTPPGKNASAVAVTPNRNNTSPTRMSYTTTRPIDAAAAAIRFPSGAMAIAVASCERGNCRGIGRITWAGPNVVLGFGASSAAGDSKPQLFKQVRKEALCDGHASWVSSRDAQATELFCPGKPQIFRASKAAYAYAKASNNYRLRFFEPVRATRFAVGVLFG